MANAGRDQNSVPTLLAYSSAADGTLVALWADPTTHRLLVDIPGGSGTVTSVSVTTANGVSGSVANPTTTPAITLTLGAITPTSVTASGALKSSTSLILVETAGTTDTVTIAAPGDVTSSYTLLLPTAQSVGTKFLQNDGSGNLSWAAGTGATTALDNLASVAINLGLVPGTAGAIDIGSATKPWGFVWFSGSSATPGTNNFKLIGASTSGTRTATFPDANTLLPIASQVLTFSGPTAARTYTFPDASDTVMTLGASQSVTAAKTFAAATLKQAGAGAGVATFAYANTATNSTLTLPTSATDTLAALGLAQTWTAAQTYNAGFLKQAGAGAGVATFAYANTATNSTLTLPTSATDTLAALGLAQTWTAAQTYGTDILIATSPKIVTNIHDTNGNILVNIGATGSAVNYVKITNAITGTAGPIIAADGETNVDLKIAGKGTGKVHHTTGVYGDVTAYSPAGAGTATLTFNTSNIHSITMPAGNITIAFSNDSVGQIITIDIIQDATGSRTVTWPAGIKWAGGVAPTLTTTASKIDSLMIRVVTAGSAYYGYVAGQNI